MLHLATRRAQHHLQSPRILEQHDMYEDRYAPRLDVPGNQFLYIQPQREDPASSCHGVYRVDADRQGCTGANR